ncbi:MAG: hypothetical protein QOH80_782 [Actinomycetota bacterium]|nr:hypothetical protein [Actinomycetota bacterium]
MSPPASRKSIARRPGAMVATALAAPMSSEMTTPPKPSCSRSSCRITIGEKTARWSGSILVYVASATITNGTPAWTAAANVCT